MTSSLHGGAGDPPPRLERALGRWTLAALVVNAIVGSGVFGLPATISRLVGADAPWAWLAGAVGNGFVMLCFAEVASRFTAAGGAYLYARAALPRFVALQVGWLAFLIRATAAAAGANLFTVHLAELLPGGGEAARLAVLTILLGALTLLNVHGVRDGARWSNLFTAAKLVPLLLLVGAGIAWLSTHGGVAPAPAAPRAATSGDWLQAVLLIAFAYGGYDGSLMAMAEARDPRRDAPFALVLAMIALAALFGLVQVVVDGVLADPGASARPLVDAAAALFGPRGGTLLAAGALVSIAGLLAANFLASPRLLYALAENDDVPGALGRVHSRFRTPHVAILTFAVAVWILAARGSFEWNAALSALGRMFVYASTCVALLVLRRRDPQGARFRLPAAPLFAALGLLFCALLATRMGRTEMVVLGALASVATLHWAVVRRGAARATTEKEAARPAGGRRRDGAS